MQVCIIIYDLCCNNDSHGSCKMGVCLNRLMYKSLDEESVLSATARIRIPIIRLMVITYNIFKTWCYYCYISCIGGDLNIRLWILNQDKRVVYFILTLRWGMFVSFFILIIDNTSIFEFDIDNSFIYSEVIGVSVTQNWKSSSLL
jgi:hypothetical protein